MTEQDDVNNAERAEEDAWRSSPEYAAWKERYDASNLRDAPFTTMSGVPVEPIYGPGPYPGEFPYTRGVYPSMYRSRLWTMRMFAGFGTAEDTNARSVSYTHLTLPTKA